MPNNLLYRRQYIIADRAINIEDHPFMFHWKSLVLKDNSAYIYYHPDLEFCYAQKDDTEIVLLGYILDAGNPTFSNQTILDELAKNTSFENCLSSTFKYGGRYILFYKNMNETKVVADALGMRELYYLLENENFWIACQPHFIGNFVAIVPQKNKDFHDFWASPNFANSDYAMIGNETAFANVYHLLPNHYLDIKEKKKLRYFPVAKINEISLEEAVAKIVPMLKGFVHSVSLRYNLMIALTAGWDSRLTVAASKEIHQKIKYFIHKFPHVSSKSPDLVIPQKLSKKLGFNFEVVPLDIDQASEDFKEFAEIAKKSYAMENNYVHAHYYCYKNHGNLATVMTTGSEISRNLYQQEAKPYSSITCEDLISVSWHGKFPYIAAQCKNWLEDLRSEVSDNQVSIYDLFFWEQRVGNWGAVNGSRNDMSRETVSIFNCRELLTVMLAVNPKYRKKYDSILYKTLMKKLWAEILSEPINPPTNVRGMSKVLLEKIGLLGIVNKARKYVDKNF